MRFIRYIFEHKAALAVIVLMFAIQACCDLALPTFTSDIVDVGIAQSGIEDAVVSDMTAETYEGISSQLEGDDLVLFQLSYAPAKEGVSDSDSQAADAANPSIYLLTDYGAAHRGELNEIMAFPLVAVHYGTNGPSDGVSSDDAMPDQQIVSAVKAEYESAGSDLWGIQMDYLIRMGLAMLGVTLLALLVHVIMNFAACRASARIGWDLRERLFERVVGFSDTEINRFSAASLITRGTNDITLVQNLSLMAMRMLVYTPIIAIGGIIMVARTNIGMGWIIALAVLIVCVFAGVLFVITIPKFKIMQKLIDRVNLVSREILTGLPVIRAFGRQKYEEDRFSKANADLLDTQVFTNRAMAFMMPGMTLAMNGVAVAIVWVGAHYVDLGIIQTGDLIAFITYSMMIIVSFLIVGIIAILIPRANVAAQRVDEVIATVSSIQDAPEVDDGAVGAGEGVSIDFDAVSFHYEAPSSDDEIDVLHDVSFHVPAGTTTAIIGPTGCGKTTVAKLIERMHDATEGSVRVDGCDVRRLSQRRLHELIGYVPQQAFLFSGSVQSNVAYSDPEMGCERIGAALAISQAADFVAAKEDGLDAAISQGGTNVSGGQRQRLCIARALAADAKAYLFDDSFSALDYKTDAALRRELEVHLAGKTVVIVAQRIATIMDADQILVMDEGRIVGRGTHDELLLGCDVYRDIALSQLSEEELAKGGVQR